MTGLIVQEWIEQSGGAEQVLATLSSANGALLAGSSASKGHTSIPSAPSRISSIDRPMSFQSRKRVGATTQSLGVAVCTGA